MNLYPGFRDEPLAPRDTHAPFYRSRATNTSEHLIRGRLTFWLAIIRELIRAGATQIYNSIIQLNNASVPEHGR